MRGVSLLTGLTRLKMHWWLRSGQGARPGTRRIRRRSLFGKKTERCGGVCCLLVKLEIVQAQGQKVAQGGLKGSSAGV
jgi:hypothetical protein